MNLNRRLLVQAVKAHRDHKGFTQEVLAKKCGAPINRSVIAHLEQGLRLPKPEILTIICKKLQIPNIYWESFTKEESLKRLEFEDILAELAGRPISLDHLDEESLASAEKQVQQLLSKTFSTENSFELFNSVLVFYGVPAVSHSFFKHYLGHDSFIRLSVFAKRVESYQIDAVQLFSSLREAYRALNSVPDVDTVIAPLKPRNVAPYANRIEWNSIDEIPDERLVDLGYVSAALVKQETKERTAIQKFLRDLADAARKTGRFDLSNINEKTKRRMDSLLRKFDSSLSHGLSSPLFAPDPDLLEREAARLAPKNETELERMGETQRTGERNLAHYLSADYMDVYVATSMRNNADFVSVNQFVRTLFTSDRVSLHRLRYFNPTQSWIEDRIAKGLVEALMLRRAAVTIYMAQKSDTFGKDSEASVALGQGRPVIVYVPKLVVENLDIDTELLFQTPRAKLVVTLESEDKELSEDIDDSLDDEALVARILTTRLNGASQEQLIKAVKDQWADFDLYSEAERIPVKLREAYRAWLDNVIVGDSSAELSEDVRSQLINVFVATAIRFELRARIFREVHPLALQIILSTGVLNGILVVRSVSQCADILNALVHNELELELEKDEHNYKLVEVTTRSTMRVISRNELLRNAFEAQYVRERRGRLGK